MHVIVLVAAAFVAGVVHLTFGMGSGALLTPLLTLLIDPATAVGTMTIVTGVAAEVETLRRYRSPGELRLLALLIPCSLVGVAIGSYLLVGLSPVTVRWIIGGMAALFGCIEWIRQALGRAGGRPWAMGWGVPFGIVAGISGALANADGLVLSLFLLQRQLDKQRFIATMNTYLLLMGLVRAVVYLKIGVLSRPMLLSTLAVLPALWLGGFIGVWLNRRVSPLRFRQALATLVLITGIMLIVH